LYCRANRSSVFASSLPSNRSTRRSLEDMMDQNRNKIPQLIKRLYEIVAELESLYPGRKFTPDGHLVGSIGEVIAAHNYDLILLEV